MYFNSPTVYLSKSRFFLVQASAAKSERLHNMLQSTVWAKQTTLSPQLILQLNQLLFTTMPPTSRLQLGFLQDYLSNENVHILLSRIVEIG